MTREKVLKIIHETIYQYFDVCGDEEETPISDKDKFLLEINKSICNNIKENWETEGDLITRQGAIDVIDRVTESHNSVDAMKICAEVRMELLTLSSAERKERWLFNRQYHEADECVCSGCGQLMTTIHGERMNYCPNCGAKMEVVG